MDINARLQISYYETVAAINEQHLVYLVRHRETGKFYVKKILKVYNLDVYRQLIANPVLGIPRIIACCEEDNCLTIIEEFISGDTIESLLEQNGAFSEEETVCFISELCSVLTALHSQTPPLIHRDIKPSNVIITPDKHVMLLDLNAARKDISKSEDTVLLGTKGYAAPEQYGFGSSGIQSDIYALGMLMNTMLAGHFSQEIQPGKLAPVIRRCLQLDPAKRYSTARDVSAAVNNKQKPATDEPKKLVPPGFRTGNIFHMFIASVVYFFIILISLTFTLENSTFPEIIMFRVSLFVFSLLAVACGTNYLNIWSHIPLCRSNNLAIKIMGIILLVAMVFFWMIILLLIGEVLLKG